MSEHLATLTRANLFGANDETRPIIVVAEDDTMSRKIIAKQLRDEGYDILEAADGKEALELIRQYHPNLLLSDWMMPGMDGLELCNAIKDDPALRHTYIVMLTSKEEKKDLVLGLDAGADDYLQKPWDSQELLARIRAGLRIEQLQRSLAARNEDLGRLTKRLNHEIAIVAGIQKAMLPQAIPRMPTLDFTAWYLPSSECGGDYYDLMELDATRKGFLIADVSGHGAPAMVTMALLRQNFHHIAKDYDHPNLLLEEINRLLCDHLPTDQFATMFYAIINTQTLTCEYASAGHNPPLLYRGGTNEISRLHNCKSFPLKLVKRDVQYAATTIQLNPNDRLILYTDGIPEYFNPQRENYGMERFENIISLHAAHSTPAQLETELVTDLMHFSENQLPEDDLTLAIIGVNAPSSPRSENHPNISDIEKR